MRSCSEKGKAPEPTPFSVLPLAPWKRPELWLHCRLGGLPGISLSLSVQSLGHPSVSLFCVRNALLGQIHIFQYSVSPDTTLNSSIARSTHCSRLRNFLPVSMTQRSSTYRYRSVDPGNSNRQCRRKETQKENNKGKKGSPCPIPALGKKRTLGEL